MLKLDARPYALKFLYSLQAKQHKQITNKMFELMQKPRPHDSIQMEEDLFRTDIGEYRIVYKFDDTTVTILAVRKRNDDAVYKQVKRMQ